MHHGNYSLVAVILLFTLVTHPKVIAETAPPGDCNIPIVGPGVVVDDISGELAGALANDPEYQNALDGDLTNYTVIELTNPSGAEDLPIISIKYTDTDVTTGRRAGFVIDIENSIGGLLGEDILDSLEINAYLDNVLQETAAVTGGGPTLSMDITGGEGSVRRIGFINTLPFDELELIFNGSASNEVSEFRIYYAFHMDATCDYDCQTTLTTDNYASLTATSGCTGVLCNSTSFPNPPAAVTDANTSNADSATVVPLGSAWVEIAIGQDIAAGSDIGFALSSSDLAGTGTLSAEALSLIEITTYDNSVLQETFSFDSTANVNVTSGDINIISFKTSNQFDAVRITFSATGSVNSWELYYGFTRPDSDNDNFVDCVDDCIGDNNFDQDGDGTPDACDNNCFASAGPDISVCPTTTTATLGPAPPGYTWSAAAGNPSPATIDNSGNITGLSAEGYYQFILSDGFCTDTVGIEYFTIQGQLECNNPLTGPNTIVDNQPNEVTDDANLVDGDLSNYASDANFVSLVLAVGGASTDIVSVKDTVETYPAGTRVGYVVRFPSGFADANLAQALALRTYLNDAVVETSILGGASFADLDALGSFDQQRISMIATAPFDEVELVALGGFVTASTALINEMRVFYAFTEPTTCPGGDGTFGSTSCELVLSGLSPFATIINYDTTGIQGVTCSQCTLDSLSYLIDSDPTNFSTLDLDIGSLSEGNVSVLMNQTADAGAKAGYLIRIGGGLLSVGVLDAFRLNTYMNGALQESVLASSPIAEMRLLSTDSELTYLSFLTTLPFNEIQFVTDASLLSTGVGTTLIDIYYAFVEYDADGDGVPNCRDKCCSGSDLLDADGDGLPDACDAGPLALPDTLVALEETPTVLNVLINDDFGLNGPGGDSIQILTPPQNGTAVLDNNGTPNDPTDDVIVYTGNEGYNGPDSIQYVICDADIDCDSAWVQISVLPVNDPPMAIDDINVTPANEVASGNVLTNDMDPDGDLLLANPVPIAGPSNGTVSLNADGSYDYTPDPGFTGEDQFSYEVCDTGIPVLCDTAVVYIEVVPDPALSSNLPPVANPDAQQTEAGTPLDGNLLSNDDDPDGDNLVINTTPLDPPSNGTVVINPDGTYTYTPDSAFVGQDTFQYEVCDDQVPALCDTTIAVIDVLPDSGNNMFAHDDAGITLEDTPLTGNVSTNDFDPEGDLQTVSTTPVVQPANGTVTLNPDGSYMYVPDPGFSGNDFFLYETCDNGAPAVCDTATVSLAVLPVNDPPMAVNDINVMPVNTPASGNVLTNDLDPEGDNLTATPTPVSGPSNGSVTLNPDGSYVYTPNPDFTGEDQFSYEVCDDGIPVMCDTAIVFLEVVPNVIPFNLPPVANPDINQTEENTPATGDLLSNDFDPNGDMLVINTTPVSNPLNGSVTINPDGTYIYTPDPGFTGQDAFSYEVCDDQVPALCDIALVVIDVIPDMSNTTSANDDAFQTTVNTSVSGNVSDNDFDAEGDNQTVSIAPVTGPANGTVSLSPDGSFTYMPANGYIGNDFFTYATCDDGTPQACDTATVYIAVLACPGVSIRMYLQGALLCSAEPRMVDDLRTNALIPLFEPYSAPPYSSRFSHVGLGGGEVITDSLAVFGNTGDNAIVDWVFVELRDQNDSTVVVETRSALLQRDGDVVDTDGVSPLSWCDLPDTLFFIAVHHRNHLGVMTAVPRSVTPDIPTVDFNTDSLYTRDATIFSVPTITVNGLNALWTGNTMLDDHILFSGVDNESDAIRNFILSDPINIILGGLLNFSIDGYEVYDVNMNGTSLFSGTKNDNDVVRDNVLQHPANVILGGLLNFSIQEQLPD